MGNEEPFSKSETKRDKVSLPKVKPGVKGGLGQWAYIEPKMDELKRLVRKSKKPN